MPFFAVSDTGEEFGAVPPLMIDQLIRQALSLCWRVAPPEKRSVEAAEAEFRRIADRAINDFRAGMRSER